MILGEIDAHVHRNRKLLPQVYLLLSEFEDGKSCLKRFLKMSASLTFTEDDILNVKNSLKGGEMFQHSAEVI